MLLHCIALSVKAVFALLYAGQFNDLPVDIIFYKDDDIIALIGLLDKLFFEYQSTVVNFASDDVPDE